MALSRALCLVGIRSCWELPITGIIGSRGRDTAYGTGVRTTNLTCFLFQPNKLRSYKMKSIFKILVLGVVPILAVTAVMDLGLAADKGSQLIFQSNMSTWKFYISVANTSQHGYGAGSVLQRRDEAGSLVAWSCSVPGSSGYPRHRKRPGRPLRSRDSGFGRADETVGDSGTATNVSDGSAALPRPTMIDGESRNQFRPFCDRRHCGGAQTWPLGQG